MPIRGSLTMTLSPPISLAGSPSPRNSVESQAQNADGKTKRCIGHPSVFAHISVLKFNRSVPNS
jgi:hypothetical protein